MMAKFLAGCLDAADNAPGDESESNSVSWNGIDFDALEDHHFEEVLWELAELNFRFELAALDGRMSGSMVSDRNHLVVTCFPDAAETGSLLIVKLECANQGLGSSDWQQKSRYLLALKSLMMGWTACTLPEIIKEEKLYGKLQNSTYWRRRSPSFTVKNFTIASAALLLFPVAFHMPLKQ